MEEMKTSLDEKRRRKNENISKSNIFTLSYEIMLCGICRLRELVRIM